MEKKVNGKALWDEREEAEEISFVPRALSIPRGPMFWCDNRCSNKALRFLQFASGVVEESYTVNLCQQCYNERLTAQDQAPLKSWQWKAVVEKKAHRSRLWKMLGKDQVFQGMWECFSLERRKRKKFLWDAEKEKQEGIQVQRQQESPAKECLEEVKSSADTDCTSRLMRYGYCALKDGDWEEYKRTLEVEVSATGWAFERIREALEKVAKYARNYV